MSDISNVFFGSNLNKECVKVGVFWGIMEFVLFPNLPSSKVALRGVNLAA